MIIKFLSGDYYEMRDQYDELWDYAYSDYTDDQEGTCLNVHGERVVIPELHVSIREADWYTRNERVLDPDADDAWNYQASVYAVYDENEKDINKYISFISGYFSYAIKDECESAGIPLDRVDDFDCYIDTSEFVSEDVVEELFP